MPGEAQEQQPADPQSVAILARRAQALDLRIDGKSYRAIATDLGVSAMQAHRDVRAALDELAELAHEKAEQLRALELSRLDIAVAGMIPKVRSGDVLAVDRLLKISERRAKLCGLDAATQHEVVITDPKALAHQMLEELIAQGLDREEARTSLLAVGVDPKDLDGA